MNMRNRILFVSLALLIALPSLAQDNQRTNVAIDAIRKAGQGGAGFDQAMVAARELRSTPIEGVTVLLDALADTNPIAENWIRGVVFDVVRRAKALPVDLLSEYAMDQANNPTGRGLAMELMQKEAPEKAEALISKCLNEVSLPLREMAVQQKMDTAKQIEKQDPQQAKAGYREALAAARHPQQLTNIVEALRKLGDEDVNIKSSFAMIGKWHSLAPLDNTDGIGYDTPYTPEQEVAAGGSVDLNAKHQGKHGSIGWTEISDSGDEGFVDLAKGYEKEKGAVCYLYGEFESSTARPVQIRLGSENASKVWINGELVLAKEVYHAGYTIDQYIAGAELKKGTNRVLLKICQNEQTESWAQDWKFQFRITDPTGKPLQSGD